MKSTVQEASSNDSSVLVEDILCTFIREELGNAEVNATTSFESIGVDSILLMEIIVQCERLTGKRLGLSVLTENDQLSVRSLLLA